MKKVLSLILTLMMLLSASALAQESPELVTIMVPGSGGGVSDWDNNAILQEIEKQTNTDIKLIWVDQSSLEELLTAAAASNTFPDMACVIDDSSKSLLNSFIKNGVIAAFEGEVAEAAPNLIKRYEENADLEELKIDGKIYFQPMYWGNNNDPNAGLIHVRQDILDKHNLGTPETWEDYVEYLRVCVNEEGINGTAFIMDNTRQDLAAGMNAYLGSYGIPYTGWYKAEDGSYQYWLTHPDTVKAVIAIRNLVAEGLVDPNAVTYSEEMVRSAFVSGSVGSIIYNGGGHIGRIQNDMALVNPEFKECMLAALDCSGGTRGYTQEPMWGMLTVIGGNDYNNTLGAARILNYLTSPEGEKMTTLGIEGVHYTETEPGVYELNLEQRMADGFPTEAGINGAHPLASGIVNWQPQEWQDWCLLDGKDESFADWYYAMRENQKRYQIPCYGYVVTTDAWSDFQSLGQEMTSRALIEAWYADSDEEAIAIWTSFQQEWKDAGGQEASDSVALLLTEMYD